MYELLIKQTEFMLLSGDFKDILIILKHFQDL